MKQRVRDNREPYTRGANDDLQAIQKRFTFKIVWVKEGTYNNNNNNNNNHGTDKQDFNVAYYNVVT